MKTALILIAVVSLGWIFFLVVFPTITHLFQIDAAVPQSVLEKATPEERKAINDGFRKLNPPPSDRSFVPPTLILALCAFGLWRGRRT